MSTQFVATVAPPGDALSNYDRHVHPSKQKDAAPAGFIDAMIVRNEVFVEEQHVPIANELDDEDVRSWHWVAYASVGAATKASAEPLGSSGARHDQDDAQVRKASATQLPIATLRLIPPQHERHPIPGSAMTFRPGAGGATWTMKDGSDYDVAFEEHQKYATHSPFNEPYVRLSRLATSPPFRGLGLSKLLISTSLEWASTHARDILPPMAATEREAARIEEDKLGGDDGLWKGFEEGWKGLVLVHAQTTAERVWEKFGFVKDEKMGTWWEENLEHVGMWKRLQIKEADAT